MRSLALLAVLLPALTHAQLPAYRPSQSELRDAYRRADEWVPNLVRNSFMLSLTPNWLEQGKRFWYRADRRGGVREFVMVESATGAKRAAFDHGRLAEALGEALGKRIDPQKLPFTTIEFKDGGMAFE